MVINIGFTGTNIYCFLLADLVGHASGISSSCGKKLDVAAGHTDETLGIGVAVVFTRGIGVIVVQECHWFLLGHVGRAGQIGGLRSS
jgi:hypothetical protein